MVDENLNLKVIDFGFAATLVNQTNGSLNLTQSLGTVGYAAPEIHLKLPYNGRQVDIFSMGVVLFMLAAGTAPFSIADSSDASYRYLLDRNEDLFWKRQQNISGRKWWNTDKQFKHLVSSMLRAEPTERAAMDQIFESEWI